jgi:hypothetical protein
LRLGGGGKEVLLVLLAIGYGSAPG